MERTRLILVAVLACMALVTAACRAEPVAELPIDDADSSIGTTTTGPTTPVEGTSTTAAALPSLPSTSSDSDSRKEVNSESQDETSRANPIADQPAGDDVADLLSSAETSPLFVREVSGSALSDSNHLVEGPPGAMLNVSDYALHTSFRSQPGYSEMFQKSFIDAHLEGNEPRSVERILELEDRAVVERTMHISIPKGKCLESEIPAALANLCLGDDAASGDRASNGDLSELRVLLAQGKESDEFRDGVTVGQALEMGDDELFDLTINSGLKTLRYVSVIPTVNIAENTPEAVITNFDSLLPLGGGPTYATGAAHSASTLSYPIDDTEQITMKTDYFLTGFTFGREQADYFRYTFWEDPWWDDSPWYLEASYSLGMGFGLRMPYSVDVTYDSIGDNERRVYLSADPVNVDEAGMPAYPAVGLDENQTFDGNEFVLEIHASCHVGGRVAWTSFSENCLTFEFAERQQMPGSLPDASIWF